MICEVPLNCNEILEIEIAKHRNDFIKKLLSNLKSSPTLECYIIQCSVAVSASYIKIPGSSLRNAKVGSRMQCDRLIPEERGHHRLNLTEL